MKTSDVTPTFKTFVSTYQQRIETELSSLFDDINNFDTTLIEAMKYSLLGGGKRIRPILVYATANACGNLNSTTDAFACALECVHVYSLIHDDLPAMDDDELRRGKPTCHIQYDEATAILAGDALQALAFDIIAQAQTTNPQTQLLAIRQLARSSGMCGMVLGQAIDLAAVDHTPTLEQLANMHKHKTGALIEASIIVGALSANANDTQIAALQQYAAHIGLAFQVQDDILDVTADTKTLGKTQGSDIERNKPTYVSLLGLEAATQKALDLRDQAIAALSSFDEKADHLRALADYIIQRKY